MIRSGISALSLMAAASTIALASGVAAQTTSPAPSNSSATEVREVVVTAPREENVARRRQETALTLLNVQSAETIAKYPDYNAAEAMGRIPGVSLSTDTGEGRFVNIRGIDANLNGATYGGVVLLNTFPAGTAASGGGRAVEFDTIPTGAIDGIVVYKTLSPDREAEGLGGEIELTPRSAKNIANPFFEGDIGWGYENLHDHTGPFTASLAAGVRFGFNNGRLVVAGDGQDAPMGSGWITNPTPFSLIITGSRKDDRRGVDDIEPSYANDGAVATDNALGEVDFRRYDYHRRRFGYGAEFNFKPNDEHSYYARADVAGYIESVHKNHFYAVLDGSPKPNPADPSGGVIDTFQPRFFQDHSEETHRNTIFTVGGADQFSALAVDYRAAYSRATYLENYYKESLWYGPKGLYATYNAKDPNHIAFNFFNDAALKSPFVSSDATQYHNPRLSQYFEADVDQEYSYVINAKYPLHLIGEGGEIKAGASVRLRDKIVNDLGARANIVANLASFTGSVGAGNNYYNGWFPNGPYVSTGSLDPLFTANIKTLPPSVGRDFKDTENVYAGYIMYTVDVGAVGILAGARVESTDATYGNYLNSTDAAGNALQTFVNHSRSYTNVFPTVQLKYTVISNLLLRATYSTGIARPGFTQAGGNAGVDFTATPRPTATTGNYNLQPTTGNNFDLDIEYYMPFGGIAQVGVFDKEFDNYIFRHAKINVADPVFGGQLGDLVTYANESAHARGFEVDYHQKFSMLPGVLSGLGIDANVTFVDSRFLEYEAAVSGTGLSESASLPGTSHVTWNLAGFYEDHGLALRLSAEYVGKSLFSLNGDKSLDTFQDKKLNLDFTSSYQFTRQLAGYFSVKNILDTPLRYYEGVSYRPIQREIYGQTFEAGLRAKF